MIMKIHRASIQSRSGWYSTFFSGLALSSSLALPAFGGDADLPLSASDETIGTLPSLGNGWDNFEYIRRWRDNRPSVYVEGTAQAILDAFVRADGTGSITVESPAPGVLRLSFHGALELHFEREAVHAGSIRIGLNVPQRFGQGQATFSWGNRSAGPRALLPGAVPLPAASMAAAGALDASALHVATVNPSGSGSTLELRTTPDALILTQVH
jgi:hypothetical protein